VADQLVRVECYAGYKGEERPVRIVFEEQVLEVTDVEDRWYSPGATYFRVLVAGGDRYVLCHDDAQDTWTLSAFRASGPERPV
jgi:hypothetical protein